MELSSIQHITPENISDYQLDLFIATLSHESRSTSIARKIEANSGRKVVFFDTNHPKENSYNSNLDYFKEKGFEFIQVTGDKIEVDEIFASIKSDKVNIMLDCTSMSQQWYYQILSWFGDNDRLLSVKIRIAYSMAAYVEEAAPLKVKKVRNFLKLKSRTKRSKRALILGLGQEPNVSEMICKIEKPDLLYLFYADPPVEKKFVERVFVNNHAVINSTPIRNLVSYPIYNGEDIYHKLIDVILPLRSEYEITLIPQGPKVFSITSMLVQMGYPDTILSYPVFKRAHVQDRMPSGDPVVMDIHLECGE